MSKPSTTVVYSEAGGATKTTTAVSLAVALAEQGNDVTLIDLDPRGASTKWLGVEPSGPGLHVGAILADPNPDGWVGDLAVPRHVKRAVGALQDRYTAYRAALAAPGDALLAAAIAARLAPAGASGGLDARQICAYIRQAGDRLDRLPSDEVLAGRVGWPQIDAAEPDAGDGRRVTEGEHAG